MDTEPNDSGPSDGHDMPPQGGVPDAPPVSAPRVGRKRSRHASPVPERTVALYTAARAFLYAEWLGALLLVASFSLLYFLTFAAKWSGPMTLLVSIGTGLVGAAIFWTARTSYRALEFPWAKRWEAVANLFAASAGIFWLLFLLLEILTVLRIPVGAP